ncbi:MAG TPA: DUF2797 domain-containing protein [Tenuifilaceae bacterium]|nr:DUF2797 domain-containing protein [Tenuifilaceae bacterium]
MAENSWNGYLTKMETENVGSEYDVIPKYFLSLGDVRLEMNQFIGKHVSIEYTGQIKCIKCGRITKKSFGQGYCYPCFISVPETEECVLRPELCKAQLGIARDMEYATNHCLIDHFVYLAWSGGVKVGVTRFHQVPTRWIDQGATHAVKLCRTKNRYSAGLVEVELKKIMSDKTPWQAMLKGVEDENLNLLFEKDKALEYINGKSLEYIPETNGLYRITYPVNEYPVKVKSHSFDKESVFSGILMGIKGQYLILESGTVLNIRKHSGYIVTVKVE